MRGRPGPYLLLSIALHVVLGAGLLYLVSIPVPFGRQRREKQAALPVDRIGFLSIPNRGVENAGRSGGDGRPLEPARRPVPRPVAPTETPTGVPTPPAAPAPAPVEPSGSGPVVGRGGTVPGITPSTEDPRLWVRTEAPVVAAPRTQAERIEREVGARIQAHNDSLAAIAQAQAGQRKPGDWTFEKGGKKYGIDQHKIYIGDHSIPSAILALLPLNVQGNPISNERERTFNAQHAEIWEQAQKQLNDADFREAVKRIRARKERERRASETQPAPAPIPAVP